MPALTNEDKLNGYHRAAKFMEELLDCWEVLADVARNHGLRTLTDLMHFQAAVMQGAFIDVYPEDSAVLDVLERMPSGELWLSFTRREHLLDAPEKP